MTSTLRPSLNVLPAECDCDPCCVRCGHTPNCSSLVPAECICPDDGAEYHREDCPAV